MRIGLKICLLPRKIRCGSIMTSTSHRFDALWLLDCMQATEKYFSSPWHFFCWVPKRLIAPLGAVSAIRLQGLERGYIVPMANCSLLALTGGIGHRLWSVVSVCRTMLCKASIPLQHTATGRALHVLLVGSYVEFLRILHLEFLRILEF